MENSQDITPMQADFRKSILAKEIDLNNRESSIRQHIHFSSLLVTKNLNEKFLLSNSKDIRRVKGKIRSSESLELLKLQLWNKNANDIISLAKILN